MLGGCTMEKVNNYILSPEATIMVAGSSKEAQKTVCHLME